MAIALSGKETFAKLRGRPVREGKVLFQPAGIQYLVHHRERADALQEPFWLLRFQWSPRGAWAAARNELTRAVVMGGSSAQWGWFDHRGLVLIARVSEAEKAIAIADELCDRLPAPFPRPQCEFRYYDPRPGRPKNGSRYHWTEDATTENYVVRPMDGIFVMPLPSWKRWLDLAVALVTGVLLMPLMVLVACVVKVSSPGPVIFKQRRTGLGGRPFVLYKFRTMVADADSRKVEVIPFSVQDGPAFKMVGDPRVTAIGRLLRKTSIDEVPQLWNVVKGDMSLVGPRPLPCEESDRLCGWQRRRLDVTPGLTGIWQVKGRSRVSFDEWVGMDLEYIQTRSLWTDLKLLLLTIPVVLSCKGAE